MLREEAPGVTITYAVVAELTDREPNSLYQAATRQSRRRLPLHIHDLESVVLWLARYGTDDLRRKMVALAAPCFIPNANYHRGGTKTGNTCQRCRNARRARHSPTPAVGDDHGHK